VTDSPRLLSREAAARYMGVSPRHLHSFSMVKPVRIGRRVLWDVRALDAWLDRARPSAANSASLIQTYREARK
jgi:predicted DNA-binding transcriptional regulator AlpA